jgi:hypothetical protein
VSIKYSLRIALSFSWVKLYGEVFVLSRTCTYNLLIYQYIETQGFCVFLIYHFDIVNRQYNALFQKINEILPPSQNVKRP